MVERIRQHLVEVFARTHVHVTKLIIGSRWIKTMDILSTVILLFKVEENECERLQCGECRACSDSMLSIKPTTECSRQQGLNSCWVSIQITVSMPGKWVVIDARIILVGLLPGLMSPRIREGNKSCGCA